jgi:cysteine synthase A
MKVKDQNAVDMYRRLHQQEGIFVGVSAGANVFAALKVALEMGKGSTIVTVLPDRGDRYITSEHYTT